MSKRDVAASVGEIVRVLRPEGLCFVNFLSVDSESYGRGEEVAPGEFLEREGGGEFLHSYFADDEPDACFEAFDVIHKEKRVREWFVAGGMHTRGYIDYVARKRPVGG